MYIQGQLIENEDFNNFAGLVTTIISDTNSNATSVSTGGFGYGQNSLLTTKLDDESITADDWVALVESIDAIAEHQGTTLDGRIVAEDIINDPTFIGHEIITAFNGIESMAIAIDSLNENRFNVAPGRTTETSGGQYGASSIDDLWVAPINHRQSIVFASANEARYFFNTGGSIIVDFGRISAVTGDPTANLQWDDLITALGTVTLTAETTGASGAGSTANLGYYNLGTSPSLIYTYNDIHNNVASVYMSRNGNTVEIEVIFDQANALPIGGTISVFVDIGYCTDEFMPMMPLTVNVISGLGSAIPVLYLPINITQTLSTLTEDDVDWPLGDSIAITGGSPGLEYEWTITTPHAGLPGTANIADHTTRQPLFTPAVNSSHWADYTVGITLSVYDNITTLTESMELFYTIEDTTAPLVVNSVAGTVDEAVFFNLQDFVAVSGGSGNRSFLWSTNSPELTITDPTDFSSTAIADDIVSVAAMSITLTVSDDELATSESTTFEMIIQDTSAALTITPFANLTADENTVFNLRDLVVAANGAGPFTWSWSVIPSSPDIVLANETTENATISIGSLRDDQLIEVSLQVTDTAYNYDVFESIQMTLLDTTPPLSATVNTANMNENDTLDLLASIIPAGGDGPYEINITADASIHGSLTGTIYTSNYVDGTAPAQVPFSAEIIDLGFSGEVINVPGIIEIANNVIPLDVVLVDVVVDENTVVDLASYIAVSGGSGSSTILWEYDANAAILDDLGVPVEFGLVYQAVDDNVSAVGMTVDSIDQILVMPIRCTVTDSNTGEIVVANATVTFNNSVP